MSKRFRRNENRRKEYSFIYIFTEGAKTEPIYFNLKRREVEKNIRKRRIKIKINDGGYKGGNNTLSLVNFALEFIGNKNNGFDKNIDECWVVFDKDDFNQDFDNAVRKANKNGLKVAYSNEAFELWFLLHFDFMDSAVGRKEYNKRITEKYIAETGNKKYRYEKVDSVMPLIEIIKNREGDAIRNAKTLLKKHGQVQPISKRNPSTTVHLLVEKLNQLKIN